MLAAGGTYDELFYRPTVLAGSPAAGTPAYEGEVFGPVAPVSRFSSVDEAVRLAARQRVRPVARHPRRRLTALALADRIPSGIVHINDQTVRRRGGRAVRRRGASGTGARFGGPAANIEAFTETQWLTMQGAIAPYPF